jgi:3D (Asp-Asp-Asp) domain-containing protein
MRAGVVGSPAPERGFSSGTRLWIEGVGLVTVHDRGGAIRGGRLDLFFRTDGEARQWGVQRLRVFVWAGP